MWRVVEAPIDAMIAALRGSTAFEVIAAFHALPAGNGRLIGARLTGFVTAFVVAAADALVVAAADGDAGLAEELTSETLGDADSDSEGVISPMDVSGGFSVWEAWVQEPASSAMARAATGRSRWRLTAAG
jgi:hypothetical protein